MTRILSPIVLMLVFAGFATAETPSSEPAAATPAPAAAAPQITTGNGEVNWIVTDGVTRNGSTFTFAEVKIEGDGWLVLHPFRDGKPYGKIYVGATFLESGTHQNVEISVPVEPAPGKMFLVMLHSDVNENREFDFVFVDERNEIDKAVFEGTKLVALTFSTP